MRFPVPSDGMASLVYPAGLVPYALHAIDDELLAAFREGGPDGEDGMHDLLDHFPFAL